MSGRSRHGNHPLKGGAGGHPPLPHDGPGRHHLHHHPALIDDVPPFPRRPPLHPAVLEDRLAGQLHDIQTLLVDNQRLAATHVALKQEVAAAHHDLVRTHDGLSSSYAEADHRLREVYEKSMKMEAELQGVEAMRAELIQMRGDIQKLNAERQALSGQVQTLTQDANRVSSDLQQVAALKAEIENMKQEVQRARAAIEYEKKGYAENYEQGQVMEKNLISMAREVEKLRAEVANSEKRARAAAAAGSQGYTGNYGNPDPNYGGNPYPANYGMNPAPGGPEGAPQYGSGSGSGSGHASWGPYDQQRALGRR